MRASVSFLSIGPIEKLFNDIIAEESEKVILHNTFAFRTPGVEVYKGSWTEEEVQGVRNQKRYTLKYSVVHLLRR